MECVVFLMANEAHRAGSLNIFIVFEIFIRVCVCVCVCV